MFRPSSSSRLGARGCAWLLLAGVLAQAQVRITCDRKEVRSREECTLQVVPDEVPPRAWRWSVAGPGNPRPILRPLSGTEVRLTAPPTRAGGGVKVLVEAADNPSLRAEFELRVTPNPKLGCTQWQERDERVPGTFTPSLCRFQGDPTARPGAHRLRAAKLCFSGEAFAGGSKALRTLDRCWLVAGGQGLQAFSPTGEAVPVPVPEPGPGRICRAVAVLPPGARPGPGAPRLAYSESTPDPFAPGAVGDEDTRIFVLGLDGVRRELDLGEAGTAGGPRTVRDLALDREGGVLVLLSGGRGLWKVDAAGRVALLALIPEGGGDPLEGLTGLALDPATGDVHVADGACVRRVTPAGAVTPVAPAKGWRSIRPCHLAVHGRELLVSDDRNSQVHALHLDSRRLATLVGPAGGGEPTRLGPVPLLNPGLPAEVCAALGGAGPVASDQDGLCLLGTGEGLALLGLPGEPLAQVLARSEGTAPQGVSRRPRTSEPVRPLSTRQANLERSRSLQTRLREYRRERKVGKRLAARKPEPAAAAKPTLRLPRRRGTSLNLKGVGLMVLLACGTLLDPATLGVQGETAPPVPPPPLDPASLINSFTARAAASMRQLDQDCALILAAGATSIPCAPEYQTGLLAQLDGLYAQMTRMLVDPSSLGAGTCLPGEPLETAKARLALDQGDLLASYDHLIADATVLQYQLYRDGFALQAVGSGLLIGQSAGYAAGEPVAGLGGIPGATLGIVGNGLAGGGFGLQTLGAWVGAKTAYLGTTYRARYQRYANGHSQDLLDACTGEGAPAGPPPAPTPPAPSPAAAGMAVPALQEAIQKLTAGCLLAGQAQLNLAVCSDETFADLRSKNGTLAELSQSVACLANGLLTGRQAPCARAPLSDARTRSDTFSYFLQFTGEMGSLGWDLITVGNAFHAASQGLFSGADFAALLGQGAGANGLVAGGYGLSTVGTGLLASGFDLLRIGAVSQGWVADMAHAFNAQSRAQLDEPEAGDSEAAQGSSTGAAAPAGAERPAGVTQVVPSTEVGGAQAPPVEAAGTGPGEAGVLAGPVAPGRDGSNLDGSGPDPAIPEISTSAATRTQPGLAWVLAVFAPARQP